MVDECVSREGHNDFRSWQLAQNPSDKRKFHLLESGLIEKENRTTGPGLPFPNTGQNALSLVFETAVAQYYPVVVNHVPTVRKNLSKMVRVTRIYIHKITFAVKVQRFRAIPIQSLCRFFHFFKHDEWRADNDFITVLKNSTSREAIDKIKPEFLLAWVDIQPIEISAKVTAQDIELRPAMFLKQGGRLVRVPPKLQGSCLRRVNGHVVVLSAFEPAPARFRRHPAPLLEEEVNAFLFTKVSNVEGPTRLHESGVRSTLPANNHPGYAFEVEFPYRTQQRFNGKKTNLYR